MLHALPRIINPLQLTLPMCDVGPGSPCICFLQTMQEKLIGWLPGHTMPGQATQCGKAWALQWQHELVFSCLLCYPNTLYSVPQQHKTRMSSTSCRISRFSKVGKNPKNITDKGGHTDRERKLLLWKNLVQHSSRHE